jgi:hypothetical protein
MIHEEMTRRKIKEAIVKTIRDNGRIHAHDLHERVRKLGGNSSKDRMLALAELENEGLIEYDDRHVRFARDP